MSRHRRKRVRRRKIAARKRDRAERAKFARTFAEIVKIRGDLNEKVEE